MRFKEQQNTSSSEILHPDLGAPFEAYLPFVKVGDTELKGRFVKLLKEVFHATSQLWQPGSCYSTEELERIIKIIQARGGAIEATFTPMTWLNSHFYLTTRLKDSEHDLVIDPFGIPNEGVSEGDHMKNKRLITPFFGEIELAPRRHQEIYSEATGIKDGVYHHFHP